MSECNGYPTWEHWNVSLWIRSDESLYRILQIACQRIKDGTTDRAGALSFMRIWCAKQTPDGADYTDETVGAVLDAEMEEL